MPFDLEKIRRELRGSALVSPYGTELSAAVVSDAFRLARVVPPAKQRWGGWAKATARGQGASGKLWAEQVGMLAHALATTSLRAETVAALKPDADPEAVLRRFFEAISPLTAEMIRSNQFRQEEFLRRWIEAVGGDVRGETPEQSRQRLEQLDYRQTLDEFRRAEKARKDKAAQRAKALEEARQREAQARGWRE